MTGKDSYVRTIEKEMRQRSYKGREAGKREKEENKWKNLSGSGI